MKNRGEKSHRGEINVSCFEEHVYCFKWAGVTHAVSTHFYISAQLAVNVNKLLNLYLSRLCRETTVKYSRSTAAGNTQ